MAILNVGKSVAAFFNITLLCVFIMSCTGRVGTPESSKNVMESLTSEEVAFLRVGQNSTSTQSMCAKSNSVSVQVSIPTGKTMYCKDISKLMSSIKLGPTCDSGNEIKEFTPYSEVVNCLDLHVCGKKMTSSQKIADKFDGVPVLQLNFENLPWGCDAKVAYSYTKDFGQMDGEFNFRVTPSNCQFCNRSQKVTCADCPPLNSNERLVAGFVIPTTCTGGACKTCSMEGSPKVFQHGDARKFYSRMTATCGQSCSLMSQTQVCNNGGWMGNPEYQFTQCSGISDPLCKCKDPVTNADIAPGGSTTPFYVGANPECGKSCNDPSERFNLVCDNGLWVDEYLNPAGIDLLGSLKSKTCSETSCRPIATSNNVVSINRNPANQSNIVKMAGGSCNTGIGSVVDGGQHTFFKSPSASCGNKCANISLSRKCEDGVFSGDSTYSYPACQDLPCGCLLPNDGRTYDSGQQVVLFKFQQAECGNACAATGNSVRVMCDNGKWRDEVGAIAAASVFTTYKETSCNDPTCSCLTKLMKDGVLQDEFIGSNVTIDVFETDKPSCASSCAAKKDTLSCRGGTLFGNQSFKYPSCKDPVCSCTVQLDGGESVGLSENGSVVLSKVKQNTPSDLTACDRASNLTTVTCKDGKLSTYDNTVYKYLQSSCLRNEYVCRVGTNQISYGSVLTLTKTSTPACGVDCENFAVYCKDGTLVRNSDRVTVVTADELALYKETATCQKANCDCPMNGYILPYGGAGRDFYKSSQGVCGQPTSCDTQKVNFTCGENKIPVPSVPSQLPSNYLYTTCNVPQCHCPLPGGGTLFSGNRTKMYSINATTCANPKACDEPQNSVSVSCDDGNLAIFDQGKFKYQSCDRPLCQCEANGEKIDFDKKVFFYKEKDLASTDRACSEVAAEFTCQSSGLLVGKNSEQVVDYPYTLCSSRSDQGNLGGTGGGNGNGTGPGDEIKRRAGMGDGGGGGAPGCADGVACTRFVATELSIGGKMEYNPCPLPWGGGYMEAYSSVTAFSKTCVQKPDKCSAHRQVRTCKFPKMTGDIQYKFSRCEEKDVCP